MTPNNDIQQAVDAIQVVDTHEHLEEESRRLKRTIDFATLFEQYASDDLRSAGMTERERERWLAPDTSLDEKWRLFEPHYRAARNTAYFRAVEIAVRDLYGIDRIAVDTIRPLSERIAQRNRPGVLKWILREQANIALSQVNADEIFIREETDREIFRQDLSVVALLGWPIPFAELEQAVNTAVKSLRGYGAAIDAVFARYAPQASAVKQQSAYWRIQRFDDVSDVTAERVFDQAIRDPEAVSADDRKALQDWSFHRCIRNAIEHKLPVKIHTGYRAGVNNMVMEEIRAAHLVNLFMQYPEAKFDLFHIAYPDTSEAVALAKHFTNVYVDMCWAWIIDLAAARQFLRQFLTAVPANKLFAFGGDFTVAEPVYGHLRLARDGIARVLSEFVEEGYLNINDAIEIAQRILRENALEVFGD